MPRMSGDAKRLCKCINDAKINFKGKDILWDLPRREVIYIYALFLFARNYMGFTTKDLKQIVNSHPSYFWVYKDLMAKDPDIVETVRKLGFSETCDSIAGLVEKIDK